MAGDEAGAAAGDVDDLAYEVGVHPLHEVLEIEVVVIDGAVELGGEVVAQVRRIQVLKVGRGLDEGAFGLGHLGPFHGQEAVGMDPGRFAEARGLKHGGPEQRVEIDDVLADEVMQFGAGVGVPEGVEVEVVAGVRQILEARHVADRRVHPDVEVLVLGAGNEKAEVGGVPGDVPGLQAFVKPLGELVGHLRLHGAAAGPALEQVAELRQVEEVVLGLPDHRFAPGDQ